MGDRTTRPDSVNHPLNAHALKLLTLQMIREVHNVLSRTVCCVQLSFTSPPLHQD